MLSLFRSEGIDVLLNTELLDVKGLSGQAISMRVRNSQGDCTLEGSDLLVATGRIPNTQGLGLERTGVETDEYGYIRVDDRLQTSAPGIWAMGECAGSPKFTHVATDDFRIVHDNLNCGNRTTQGRLVPFCMFTDPELARVGLSELEAQKQAIPYRLATIPMAKVRRAHTLSETHGFLKALISADTDEILGFTGFGTEAGELMGVVQIATLAKQPHTLLRDAILTHPTGGGSDRLVRCGSGPSQSAHYRASPGRTRGRSCCVKFIRLERSRCAPEPRRSSWLLKKFRYLATDPNC